MARLLYACGNLRVGGNGNNKIDPGFGKIALFNINTATINIRLCKFRIYFNSFGKIGNGLGELALFVINNAAVIIGA